MLAQLLITDFSVIGLVVMTAEINFV